MAADNVIDESVVRISPDLRGFRKELQAKLKAAVAGVTAKVKLQADATGWAASVRKELAARPQATAKVRLVADARGLQRSIDTALRQRGLSTGAARGGSRASTRADDSEYQRVRSNIEKVQRAEDQSYQTRYARARGYQEAIDRAHSQAISEQLRRTRTSEDTNTRLVAKAERERARLRSSTGRRTANPLLKASEGNGIIDLGGQGIKPSNIPLAALAALSPALLSIASSATLAASSVAAIGAAGIGAVAGVTALVVGFSRIREALTLREQVRKEEQRATAATAENVAAERSRARAIVMGNRAVRDSIRSLADARRSAADADKAAGQARAGINVAYREAAQYVRDLREELSDLARQEQQDALDVASAKERLASVNNNYWATDLEKRQAALDVQKALDDQSDNKRDEVAKRKELNKLDRDGIGQSKQVLEARQRAADAERAAADAHYAVTRAQEQAADALYDLAEAKRADTTTTTAASAASQDLAAKIASLSPAAREMYYWFKNNEGMLDKLRSKMEQAVLPGFLTFLREITDRGKRGRGTSSLDIMADSAARLGKIAGSTVGKLGKLTKSPWFRKDMAKINTENEKSFTLLGDASLAFVKPLTTIIAKASPLFTRFSKWLLTITEQFAAFIDKADKNGTLVQWFKDAGDEAGKWGRILGNLLGFLKSVFSASLPSGKDLVTRIGDATALLNDWGKSAQGQAQLAKFFQFFKDLDYRKIATLAGSIGSIVATLKVFTFGRKHPFFALMALFAAKYPEGTADLLSRVAGAMRDTLTFIGEHPAWAATLLAIVTAARYNKAISVGFKLLGLGEGLAGKIAAAFGKTTTATMYVTAGVVNVGGVGAGLPGKGAKGAATAGAAGSVLSLPVVAGIVAAVAATAYSFDQGRQGKTSTDVFFTPFKEFLDDPGLMTGFKANLAAAAWAPGGEILQAARALGFLTAPDKKPKGGGDATPAQVAAGEERGAFGKVQDFIANRGGSLKGMSKKETLEFKYLMDDYLRLRKKSVTAAVDETRATKGIAAAMKELGVQNTATSKTVASVYQNFGVTNAKASQFASIVTGFPDKKTTELGVNTVAGKKHLADIQKDLDRATAPHPVTFDFPHIDTRKQELKNINAQIAKIVGTKEARIKITKGSEVDKELKNKLIIQAALQSGLGIVEEKRRYEKAETLAMKADGGRIEGYSPHSKADNIPAMLTANEYVQPVSAVKKYGVGMMEDIRTGRFPRYAAGGSVQWPFNVDVSKTKTDFDTANPLFTGKTVGSLEVARIAEAQARAMGASNKQLVALIEAGIVESGMRNLSYGDRDSVGFLQQRAGWGSRAERMNVAVATAKFIRAAKHKDRKRYTAGRLAQAVQVSARPLEYDKREADAYNIINRELPGITGGPATGLGGRKGKSGYQWQIKVLREMFGKRVHVTSTTGGGHARGSYHYRGRAIDITPSRDIAQWIYSNYGASTKELITPWLDLMLKNGTRHKYSAALERQHKNHIHWAMAGGGLVPNVPMKRYDTGGGLPPGVSLAVNGTGHTETIRTAQQEKNLNSATRLDKRDIALLAQYITAASQRPIHMDGRRVAEIVHTYNYMPGGV